MKAQLSNNATAVFSRSYEVEFGKILTELKINYFFGMEINSQITLGLVNE